MTHPARSRSTDRRFYGVVEGIVVANGDKKGKEGRVKLKFPWFDEQMVTEWCRVRQPYAGNGYGAFFVPEEGDEVLVAFIQGDMRFPIILGGLYNGKDKPPTWRDGQTKDEKLIRTKGKHELLFDDSKNKEKIRLKTAKSHVALLDDHNKAISVTSTGGHEIKIDDAAKTITIKTAKGHTLLLDDQGSKIDMHTAGGATMTMEDTGTKITVSVSGQSVTLESSGITVKGSKVTVQAQEVAVTAPKVELGGSGAMALVTDLFTAVFNAHTHNCTAPGAPSGPPLMPLTPAVCTKLVKAL